LILNGALPAFDLSGLELALIGARGLFIAALFSGFGALVFDASVARCSTSGMAREAAVSLSRQRERLARISITLAVALALIWLALETDALAAGEASLTALSSIPETLFGTEFGNIAGLQILALLGSLAALGRTQKTRPRLALAFMLAATALQAGHGHALAMEKGPSLLLVSEVGHLLCAGAWLGGLAPLFLVVRTAPQESAMSAARNFSPLGAVCVAGLAVSASVQGWVLIGGIPGLIGTAYGLTASLKIIFFVILLGFAAANRYRLTPALKNADRTRGRRALLRSIGLETCFGLMVVIAASVLTALPPAIHDQPVWPFTVQPSLTTIQEDPEFRQEVERAVALLAIAVLLLFAGVFFRTIRWWARGPAIVVAVVLAWIALPHLDLLFIEASPTSFYRSPTGFSATSIIDGAALYPGHCASCHGAEGRGDGSAGKASLPEPPADLTAPHLWAHSDGEMFWWLTHGIDAPNGGLAMPGFAGVLSEDQRWSLIDFVRAHNAGLAYAETGSWPFPIQAPGFQALCADGETVSSEDLRGKIVRLAFVGKDGQDLPPANEQQRVQVVTILAPARRGFEISNLSGCVIEDSGISQAYAIIAGISADAIEGGRFLIGPNGFMRGMWRADGKASGNPAENLDDPAVLQAEIARIVAGPIGIASAGHVHHH
jgi:putative copper export protein/mono/diheme cytochrome c family protein